MSRLPNDNLHNLATQMAIYTGPTLLGAQGGTERALLVDLTEGCFELLGQIGQRLRQRKQVRFIDLQREGLWLAEELANAYMREANCLLEVETQHLLRAMILRSLRCMLVVSDEQFVVLKYEVYEWAQLMYRFVNMGSPIYGGRQPIVA